MRRTQKSTHFPPTAYVILKMLFDLSFVVFSFKRDIMIQNIVNKTIKNFEMNDALQELGSVIIKKLSFTLPGKGI